jgi:hypothetical protein
MSKTEAIPTPELGKMHAVQDRSQAIGEFLDWIQQEKGYDIGKFHTHSEDCYSFKIYGKESAHEEELEDGHYRAPQCSMSESAIYLVHFSIEKLLAEYFEIDLQKADDEKRAILESLRSVEA